MKINIKTPGVHHIALLVSDYESAKHFYVETLGFQIILEQPNVIISCDPKNERPFCQGIL